MRGAPATWEILQLLHAKYYGEDQKNISYYKSAPGCYITFIKQLHESLR